MIEPRRPIPDPPPAELCAHCKSFCDHGPESHRCRRYPPEFVITSGLGEWLQPWVDIDDRCGEFSLHPKFSRPTMDPQSPPRKESAMAKPVGPAPHMPPWETHYCRPRLVRAVKWNGSVEHASRLGLELNKPGVARMGNSYGHEVATVGDWIVTYPSGAREVIMSEDFEDQFREITPPDKHP